VDESVEDDESELLLEELELGVVDDVVLGLVLLSVELLLGLVVEP
jgi:hypothetical protein